MMRLWSLGKSARRGTAFFESLSFNTNPLLCCTSFNPSNFYDCHQRKCHVEMEKEANSGMIASNATECCKELKTQKIKYQKVTKGDVIDLRKCLFTHYRDYLIRYNDKTQVKAEHLAGKVIIMYFVSLSPHPIAKRKERFCTSLLWKIYKYLQHNHAFEIVFVAIGDGNERESKKRFEDIFSSMPWTAIPFSDVVCRKSLQTNFFVNDTTTSFVVDSNGLVLQRDAIHFIQIYGVMGFPFSDKRIRVLDAEDDAAIQEPSLITLLGSPQRDYVITNKGEKVPIYTLEGKVVVLYFHLEGQCGSAERLQRVYEESAKTKENFEVVLIYITAANYANYCQNEESFWRVFRTMPWLALPFQDPSVEKLMRIFEFAIEYDDDHFEQRPVLVVFGPHGEFIEPLGDCILGVYPVYPFTCEKVAKFETEKVKSLKMEMLWDPKTVFRRTDGSEMRFSQLAGKRVIHFFEKEDVESDHRFLTKLKERYLKLKGTNDEFEVIHILKKNMNTILPIQDLPWFVSLTSDLLPDSFDINGCYGDDDHCQSTLLAFDQDGKLVRRTIFPVFENIDFPFYAGSLEEETLSQLIDLFGWDYWTFYPGKGRIYTLHKKLRQTGCSLDVGYRVWSFNI